MEAVESHDILVGVEPIPHLGIYEKDDYKMMGKLFYHKSEGLFPSNATFLPINLQNALRNLEEKEQKNDVFFKSKKTIIQYFDGSVFKFNEKSMNHSSFL